VDGALGKDGENVSWYSEGIGVAVGSGKDVGSTVEVIVGSSVAVDGAIVGLLPLSAWPVGRIVVEGALGKDGENVSRYSEGIGVAVGSGSGVGSIVPPVSVDGIRVVAVGDRNKDGAAVPSSAPAVGLSVFEATGDIEVSVGTDGEVVGGTDSSFSRLGLEVTARVGGDDGGAKVSSFILFLDGTGVAVDTGTDVGFRIN
jgi:hypothetical protein